MLEAVNLGCVRGDRRLFKGLNFALAPGELIELRGANGVGKTSLLRIICGLAEPAEGEVRWQTKNIRALGEEYFGDIAYLAHQNGVKDELSSIENVSISSALSGRRLSREETRTGLARVGLNDYENLPARLLSAGQRRRVALARLISSPAKLWVLDEVLASLDAGAMELSRNFISEHLSAGGMAIVATHQDLNLSVRSTRRINLGS